MEGKTREVESVAPTEGYEFVASENPPFAHFKERIELSTPHGASYEREEYGSPDAEELVIIIGGRGSMFFDEGDRIVYEMLSSRLARGQQADPQHGLDVPISGFHVFTYLFGHDLVTDDAQASKQNLEDVAEGIVKHIESLYQNGNTERLSIVGTSQGAPIAMLVAAHIQQKVFLGLNVPAVPTKGEVSEQILPEMNELISQMDNVESIQVVCSERDKYFPFKSTDQFVAALRQHFPDEMLDINIDRMYEHAPAGAITFTHPIPLIRHIARLPELPQ